MKQVNYFKSLRRSLSVLKCFTPQELELSGAEVARKLGIHRTSAYRILEVMAQEGLIERDEITDKYTIGPALYVLGSLYLSSTDVLRAAELVFAKLNEMTTEVVSMAILEKGNTVYIMKEESRHPIRYYHHIGSIFPAYATAMGRALLSELTDVEIDKLYPEERLPALTAKTISTKTRLKAKLEEIRKTGVSFESGGAIEDVEGIASVVRDAHGKAVAAISFAVPVFRMNPARRTQLATLIQLGASHISYRLGYYQQDYPVRSIEELQYWWNHNQVDSASPRTKLPLA